ncbi:MAG: protein CapI [Rhodospirillales bacterium]|nr:protein CapI [Rhodospirillales bacterium]MBC93059.1 protein CapI [Rhodospirillaceae bacterium]
MTILVTGAAGFIGMHVAQALLMRGEEVIGVDNINSYYDVSLKEARIALLKTYNNFKFKKIDIADQEALFSLKDGITRIVHLAAQAGVRYSITNPESYVSSNLIGHLNVIEFARRIENKLSNMVYASSSSVYGNNTKLPFSVDDRTEKPISFYAATKLADELMSYAYSHTYGFPQIGLRLFTVYGPWGRPDMSAYIFTSKILSGKKIPVYKHGDMQRDFTYIDDVVDGILSALDKPPKNNIPHHQIYNLGNNKAESLMRYIGVIEKALGKEAIIDFQPLQTGDVQSTFADIKSSQRDLGYYPSTTIDEGIPRFIRWYFEYHQL